MNFELFIKRATQELERKFNIEPYSNNLVVPLGSWQANHNREATENLIKMNRENILEMEGGFEEAMSYLVRLLKNILTENQ